ncbi:SWIM zinc finger domain-containing protein [Patescibacteria group bacterium]|nr:SWIM zinc finger domain-containing protein [Patescibacteria group bacterium]MCG2694695.1 SWIM zinc finger domain-containing protein [Candidatus Parcubacteria bacterium]
MQPKYDLRKIKFSVDEGTFKRAVGLYEGGKVIDFEDNLRGYSATVTGTSPYFISVSNTDIRKGNCDCYVAQNKNELCKHMVAVAIYSILRGEKMKEDESAIEEFACSGKLGELSNEELFEVKKEISSATKFIKGYTGPSKKWFEYQSSLSEGVCMLELVFSKLPVSKQTSDLVIKTLLKLDNKLCKGGVDDSDGTVGNFIYGSVEILKDFAKLDKNCLKSFKIFEKQETCFGWEKDLNLKEI